MMKPLRLAKKECSKSGHILIRGEAKNPSLETHVILSGYSFFRINPKARRGPTQKVYQFVCSRCVAKLREDEADMAWVKAPEKASEKCQRKGHVPVDYAIEFHGHVMEPAQRLFNGELKMTYPCERCGTYLSEDEVDSA